MGMKSKSMLLQYWCFRAQWLHHIHLECLTFGCALCLLDCTVKHQGISLVSAQVLCHTSSQRVRFVAGRLLRVPSPAQWPHWQQEGRESRDETLKNTKMDLCEAKRDRGQRGRVLVCEKKKDNKKSERMTKLGKRDTKWKWERDGVSWVQSTKRKKNIKWQGEKGVTTRE